MMMTGLNAEAVKDREGAVRKDRATWENDDRWIYNDLDRGFVEAKRTGKPLLVVLRCIPCLACAGLDARVLMEEQELQPLLEKFICVRLINVNALDLSVFQFDYDLSFSTLIFNGDGTLYGRFGSWTHQKNATDESISGYLRTLEGALKLHAGYPGNKASLAGKQGGPMPFKSPLEIPLLAGRYERDLNWQGKVVQSCVHCHQIGDAFRAWHRDQKKPLPVEWIYPMPASETVGFTLAADQAAKVQQVEEGSAAAESGLLPGDELVNLSGQPVISIADVSWVLHRAAENDELPVTVRRGGMDQALKLKLLPGWRDQTNISGRVAAWPMRGMALGGMVLEAVPPSDRTSQGLPAEGMALRVKGLGAYGKHAAAKNAGFQKEDILIEVDGKDQILTESALLGHLLRHRFSGETVVVKLLRSGQKLELQLPMQ
ncbi:Trx7/PDZ domain-containing (seleno)protein [Verrucomicrobium sp. BvORR106]|uniref:Trx7/PDZ domain-containing (seleno)protein n=1 Tax=Verrucomicrobium sp. BvORR106 TaxID=1403819 RepID=UPI00056DA8B7|nr:Trx7/PDZ domain-containing (seleno)protein [Verrucomicrobium sp. BvORR106]